MARITREQLVELLTTLATERRSASIVTITARTVPKVKKGSGRGQAPANPYFGRCEKVARVNGIVNWRYANAVNNQRAREHDGPIEDLEHFEAEPRRWGQRQDGLPFVEHGEKLYLELKVERSLDHSYFASDTGEQFDNEAVEEWITRRDESGRQDVERPVILRDYGIESITHIKTGGIEYEVTD